MENFKSFDGKNFQDAIKNKDYTRLKVNVSSAIANDPGFRGDEIERVLDILQEEVPEIFEDYKHLNYEYDLDRDQWNKGYFDEMTYWLQRNFSKERLEKLKEVGRTISPPPTPTPGPRKSETESWWKRYLPWIVLAVVVIAIVVILILRHKRDANI